jgi:GTP-binding protein
MTQPNARPPTFVVFSSRAEKLPESYRRYLIQGIRAAFDLDGVPVRLNLRKGKNPYATK